MAPLCAGQRLGRRPRSRRATLVWFGLALAGPSSALAAGVATTPIIDDGVSVSIARIGAVNRVSGKIDAVELRIEVVDDQTAALRGYRSMASVVDIDCSGERDRVRSARAFELAHLSGPSHAHSVSGEWVRPTPEAYLAKVIKLVCSNQRLGRPPAASVQAAPAPGAAPAHAPSSDAATQKVSISEPAPQSRTGAVSADPSAPRTNIAAGRSAGAQPARPRVQVASSASRRAAEQALGTVSPEVRAPLAGEVEAAKVRGKTVYRSVVANFVSVSDAQAFCADMKARRRACVVWTGRAARSH